MWHIELVFQEHPFDLLVSQVLPAVIREKQASRRLAIWSNACSSGQEIYSIALLIREHFPQLMAWDLRLLASDISTQVLRKAEKGRFSPTEVARGLPQVLKDKYFRLNGDAWEIDAEIRRMIEFVPVNLVESFPQLPTMDIVFLRNVLIYFDTQTKCEVLRKTRRVITEAGYLFLGGGESTLSLDVPFQRYQIGRGVFYRPC